jgi:hypothetical protein
MPPAPRHSANKCPSSFLSSVVTGSLRHRTLQTHKDRSFADEKTTTINQQFDRIDRFKVSLFSINNKTTTTKRQQNTSSKKKKKTLIFFFSLAIPGFFVGVIVNS